MTGLGRMTGRPAVGNASFGRCFQNSSAGRHEQYKRKRLPTLPTPGPLMAFPTHPPAVLDALRKYDTPTVCNAIELFDAIPRTDGYLDQRIRACFPHLPPM